MVVLEEQAMGGDTRYWVGWSQGGDGRSERVAGSGNGCYADHFGDAYLGRVLARRLAQALRLNQSLSASERSFVSRPRRCHKKQCTLPETGQASHLRCYGLPITHPSFRLGSDT